MIIIIIMHIFILFFCLQNLRHVWIFASKRFTANGLTWDGLKYQLKWLSDNQVFLTISGAPEGSIHIIQLGGLWTQIGDWVIPRAYRPPKVGEGM